MLIFLHILSPQHRFGGGKWNTMLQILFPCSRYGFGENRFCPRMFEYLLRDWQPQRRSRVSSSNPLCTAWNKSKAGKKLFRTRQATLSRQIIWTKGSDLECRGNTYAWCHKAVNWSTLKTSVLVDIIIFLHVLSFWLQLNLLSTKSSFLNEFSIQVFSLSKKKKAVIISLRLSSYPLAGSERRPSTSSRPSVRKGRVLTRSHTAS